MADIQKLAEAIQVGNTQEVQKLIRRACDEGIPPGKILNEGLIAGMAIVGAKFKSGELFLPEVLVAAKAMQSGMGILKPKLEESKIKLGAKIIIGTVKGDLHDIGKNLVKMMLVGAGFELFDLGVDVPAEKFVEAIRLPGVEMLGMSALLTTTMSEMEKTIHAIIKAGFRDKLKIIVGGVPVTQEFANEIGADGYAPDATAAVNKFKALAL